MRVIVGAVVGVVVIALASAAILVRYQQTFSAGQEVRQALQPADDHANAAAAEISQLDRALQVYAFDPGRTTLTNFNKIYATTKTEVLAIETTTAPQLDQARENAQAVSDNLAIWRRQVADPVIAATRSGNSAQARTLINAPKSLAMFSALEESSRTLSQDLSKQRHDAVDETANFIQQLGVALVVGAILAILMFALSIYLVIRWFLSPLNQLRRQLRQVARRGHHNDPIIPNGPPEIAAAGSDAELMRRELITQKDEARAATEGLAQEGPVVNDLRELLAPANQEFTTPTWQIAGSSHAAEGVMGGDWWDTFTLNDGRIATVLTDVAGHGSEAAITALNSKITVSDAIKDTSDLATIASYLAECFGDTSFEATQGDDDETRFGTSVLFAFNPSTYELEWINAGHPAPIVIDSDGLVTKLEPTGPIMSALGGNWRANTVTLNPGQSVIAWTDGLSEARDNQGRFIDDDGVATIVEHINQQRMSSASKLVPRVLNSVRSRATNWNHDDTTLVIAQVR